MPQLGLATLRAWLRRQSLRRGLLGASRVWMVVFLAGSSVRVLRFLMRSRKPVTVFSERIAAGEGFEIRSVARRRD